MWTRFMDMHSGGGIKEKNYEYIYIEAPQKEAEIIFYNRFGHSPNRVTCTCCGEDYSISEGEDLDQITAYERGCDYAYFKKGKEIPKKDGWKSGVGMLRGVTAKYVERAGSDDKTHLSLARYLKKKNVLVIRKSEITKDERVGELPEQGYVWK